VRVYFAISLIVIAVMGYRLGESDVNLAQTEHEHYCQMVQIWQDTEGDFGWPDYLDKGDTCEILKFD
jgi:hypothetical protein